jgi:xanthine dehydrogenase iron-sulfur cluster and FAD-binding subunit A
MDKQMSSNQLKITAISVPDLARLLKRAGSRHVSEATIQKDIDAGAPVNSDGTINLINYTAYLLKEEVHNANN